MKRLIFTLAFILAISYGFAQVSNVADFRIANATTAFGVNLPVGTKVYNIATGEYWVATAGVTSTSTLTTASASFTLLNSSGTDDQTASEVTVTPDGNLAASDVQSALTELQGDIDGISDTDDQTASEVNITDTDGNYSATTVEGALEEVADSVSQHRTDIDQNATDIAGITSNVSTALSTGTVSDTTYGITSDGGTDDLILAAATSSAAGLMTADQYTKLDGIATGAEVNLTTITEAFEEDDGSATAHSLSQTADTSEGCVVSLNGFILPPSKYTFTSSSITIGVPVYQYDQVVITYKY